MKRKINSKTVQDYLTHSADSLDDEIPKLDGAELLIRSDYFQQICDLFEKKEAFYKIYKVDYER